MREYTEAIRLLFTRKEISYHGEFVNIDGIQVDIPNADKGPIDIPIYIGATGPKMHELAGEIGDGVVMNYWVSVDYTREMVDRVKVGAEKSGRKLEDIDRVQLLSVSVSKDRKEALDAARYEAAYYLGYEPHIMKASGASQELLDEIHKITTWPATEEKQRKAMHLIPDELVQNICAAGTPEECRKKVREYIDAGCTCPILSGLTPDVELLVDTFAKEL
jgi:5,10-methylenetetrahydromethanopterin reductase